MTLKCGNKRGAGGFVRPSVRLLERGSIAFCHETGLAYVSCVPFRMPLARLAAAQAVLEEKSAVVAKDG